MQTVEKIWMNGELVDWADANVHESTRPEWLDRV
jgi:branched-subunit amino acid aminotransferase/4-amino-4-deoxychorismate lyase